MTPEQAWQSVLGQLQMEMPRASFDTWVRDTQLLTCENGLVIISVRNQYARDWLENRLTSTVARLLAGMLNQGVDVRFEVAFNEPEESKEQPELDEDEPRAEEAVVEINQRAFRESGELHPTEATYAWAQHYANMNDDYLGGLGIHPSVTDIQVNDAKDTVYVAVAADISALFPSIVPRVFVEETGTAQARVFGR